jgi:UV DNA damage endonuclease
MSIGYACIARGVPHTEMKKCLIKNADEARLHQLTGNNLCALERMVDYNITNGIHLFRISSDIIPFASNLVNSIPWAQFYKDSLASIGQKIRKGGMRVSMHPGQYTVLNSPSQQTVENAVRELSYHALFLDTLGMDGNCKIILHVGGAYGDKRAAVTRFHEKYQTLDDNIKARLVIENDDKIYNIQDVLDIGIKNQIPVVFDALHHRANPANPANVNRDVNTWIAQCAGTWRSADGRQKIHYSQPDSSKMPGAHSQSIDIDPFLNFYNSLEEPVPDIMLEVKDKNISALKCMLCTNGNRNIGALEREWGRYKYLVLEHSQRHYQQIRQLLKDKTSYPATAFYRLVEAALTQPVDTGSTVNTAAHIWGYFKDIASSNQKAGFQRMLDGYLASQVPLSSVKRMLFKLAEIYKQEYLLQSYYFI